jgi:hypothetical protein
LNQFLLLEDAMFNKLWEFIRDEKNQKALSLIGGAVAAVVVGIWAVWQYQHPKTEPPKSAPSAAIAPVSPAVQLRQTSAANAAPGPSAVSGDRGVSVNAGGSSRVIINQKGE